MRLVEAADEIGPGVGQREAVAAPQHGRPAGCKRIDAVRACSCSDRGPAACKSSLRGALNSTPAAMRALPAGVCAAHAA